MTITAERRKIMRGTKRTCLACEVRFYDLARSAIVCPACGAPYKVQAEPIFQVKARSPRFGSGTGWRSLPYERTEPVLPVADVGPSGDASDAVVAPDETEETVTAEAEDTVLLEPEGSEGDDYGLVDHDAADAKE